MEFLKSSYNADNMQQMLDLFTELTGIRAAYFREATEMVTGKSKKICRLCTEIRKLPGMREGCVASDRAAFLEAERSRKLYLYTCHLGLWEAVVPLYIENCFAGCLMLGQVRYEGDMEKQWAHIKDKLIKSGINDGELQAFEAAFTEVQAFSMQRIEAAAKLLEIITHYVINSEIVQLQVVEAVDRAINYIKANFKKKLSSRRISRITGLSYSHLSHIFHRETGFTITEYLERVRMDFAKEQLLVTSATIKEIAAEAGYEDQNYFSRVFRKQTGCSPTNYRNRRM